MSKKSEESEVERKRDRKKTNYERHVNRKKIDGKKGSRSLHIQQ